MKVNGPGSASTPGGARPVRAPASGPAFSVAKASGTGEPTGALAATGATAVNSVEALIALQEVGGALERKRRAVGRARNILDALESLKVDLLGDGLDPVVLERLALSVREQRALTDDPKLEAVLDEIETRAAVELAKAQVPKTPA